MEGEASLSLAPAEAESLAGEPAYEATLETDALESEGVRWQDAGRAYTNGTGTLAASAPTMELASAAERIDWLAAEALPGDAPTAWAQVDAQPVASAASEMTRPAFEAPHLEATLSALVPDVHPGASAAAEMTWPAIEPLPCETIAPTVLATGPVVEQLAVGAVAPAPPAEMPNDEFTVRPAVPAHEADVVLPPSEPAGIATAGLPKKKAAPGDDDADVFRCSKCDSRDIWRFGRVKGIRRMIAGLVGGQWYRCRGCGARLLTRRFGPGESKDDDD